MLQRHGTFALWVAIAAAWAPAPANADKGGTPRNDAVYPLFGLTKTGGPFPTDFFTRADPTQNTCERVNLPKPADCVANASECVELDLLNQLDGFSVRPRLSIPFHGAIDPYSVDSSTVFLVSLGDALVGGVPSCAPPALDGEGEDDEALLPPGAGFIVGIEQVVWDPPSTTLYVQTDQALEQHTRYALLVTRGVRDASGNPVDRSKVFSRAIGDDEDDGTALLDSTVLAYEGWLRAAVAIAQRAGIRRHDVVGASVFTTMSATAVMEKLRDQVNAGPSAAPVDFGIAPGGAPAVFDLSSITKVVFNQQLDLTSPLKAQDLTTSRLPLLKIYPGAIGRIAYGRYRSTNYLGPDPGFPDALMTPVATFSGTPVPVPVRGTNDVVEDVYVNVFVPSGARPANGWPVVIFGHGGGDNINGAVFNVAATFAKWGLATIGFNEAGCGFGPKSTVTVTFSNGSATTFPVAGRAIDVNGDGKYDVCEGSGVATGPKRLLDGRDGFGQTIASLVQLVRALQAGVHLDAGGTPDLDASRIFYTGISAGATIGAILAAIEPRVRATAVASIGGRPSPALVPANRSAVGDFLKAHLPPLLNPPGTPVVTMVGGLPAAPPFFNENLPFPGANSPPSSDPVINDVAGALAIQEILDRQDWLNTPTSGGTAYARHLRLKPLAGVPARPFLILTPRGDQTIVNPNTLETIRNGLLADRVVLYRHDLFSGRAAFKNPHTLLIRTDNAAMKNVALQAQQAIAAFFASDGAADLSAIDPDGPCQADGTGCLFESPADEIPEGYGFTL